MRRSINELRRFEANWNGYGEVPPDPKILDATERFVESLALDAAPVPQVVPMTRGRLQLEWHRGSRSLEVEFESPEKLHYLKWDSETGVQEEDIVPVQDTATIRELLSWFVSGAQTGDMFIQPPYDRWRRITPGMTENEVIALLGEPLERQSWESYIASVIAEGYTREQANKSVEFQKSFARNLFPWTYGRIQYDSPTMPAGYEFVLAFFEGRVEEIYDPFDGNLSLDGRPTTPELILPAENALFDHYPRFLDLRWTPSSGVYPMEYEIEIGSGDPTTEIEVMSELSPLTEVLSYEVDETLRSRMPYVAASFSGGTGRWRVRAKNRLGVSRWSNYRHFEFE